MNVPSAGITINFIMMIPYNVLITILKFYPDSMLMTYYFILILFLLIS